MMRRVFCGLAGLTLLSLALISGTGYAEIFQGVEFPGGAESFADNVVSYNPVIDEWNSPTPPFRVPGNALGPPNFEGLYDPATFVSLGSGGSITLMFTDNSLTGSGDESPDLWIFEVGGDVEATFVKISKDGEKWFDVGKISGSTRGVDIDRYGYGPNDFFLYVRLTDDPNQGTPSSKDLPMPGADIDAVGAISSAPPVKQPWLSASPEVVKAGEAITVTFSDVPEDLLDAVIIMVDVNYPDIYSPFNSFHLYGQTNGSTTFTMEVPGEFNARLLKGAWVGPFGETTLGERLAVSNTVRVEVSKPRLSASPEEVKVGETITVTFSDVPKDLPDAVIIIVDVNYPDTYSPFNSFHLYGQTNGSTTFTMEVPGEYNARLLKEAWVGPFGGTTLGERLAVSNTVRVVLGEKKRLTISEVTGSPGQTVSVPVNINDAEGLAGLDITIAYDSSALTFNEVKASSSFSGLDPVVNSSITGKIILRIVGYDIPDGGSAFLNISFTINPNAVPNTEASITVESIEAFDEDGRDISITAQGGKVKIESPYMKGDLDGDGKISQNDAMVLLHISAGLITPTPQQLFAADFNNDGEIKSNDAILVFREADKSSSAPNINRVIYD